MSIEAMKLALEALRETETYNTQNREQYQLELDAMEALRAAIEQAEKQKPVAWHHPDCKGECIACLIEREVQNAYGNQGVGYLRRHVTTPPQRSWQGLTDEEAVEIEEAYPDKRWAIIQTEAKLKEKNAWPT